MATDNKYDRQLRLWGSNGQRALMGSHILLVNADSAGTETLKNLVLPGVGTFTILDEHLLNESDLGSNFFCEASGLGKPRCEKVAELLCEMNSDVQGNAIFGNLSSAVGSDAEFLSRFNLVIASNLPEAHMLQLSEACWLRNIPLIVVRSYGLLGYVRVQVKQHDVVESKPDGQMAPIVWDLRLANPFPELAEFCQQVNFAQLDWITHKHVPCVVILTNLIAQWKETHNGQLPMTKADKEAFVEGIKALSNGNVPADYVAQMERDAAEGQTVTSWALVEKENFAEAIKEAFRAYGVVKIPGEVMDMIADEVSSMGTDPSATATAAATAAATAIATSTAIGIDGNGNGNGSGSSCPAGLTPNISPINTPVTLSQWTSILLKALYAFIQLSPSGSPPLSGQVPDMFSTTDLFISLQEVYHRKAAADKLLFESLVAQLAAAAGIEPGNTVSQEFIDIFCKNIFNLRRIRTRSIAQEYAEPERDNILMAYSDAAESITPEPTQSPILWYLAMRAADRFQTKHGHWPGESLSDDAALLSDETDALWTECQTLVEEFGLAEQDGDLLTRDHAVEMVRFGAGDVHNIGSIVGGIASQEAVKLLTHQYIPINNTYLFNGIVCAGRVYEL